MGYDLHITRRENWVDRETPGIYMEEWLTYVSSDKELELTNGYEIKIGLEKMYQNSPGHCEWNAHPTDQKPNWRPWFDYWQGSINTKNPDLYTIRKMMHIASALNAKVQGDDGEFYTEENVSEMEREEKNNTEKSLARQTIEKPWWKFW